MGDNESLRRKVERVLIERKEPMPARLTAKQLEELVGKGIIITASSVIYDALDQILHNASTVVSLPENFNVGTDRANEIIKGVEPEHYIMLDSVPVIREGLRISKNHAERYGKRWSIPKSKGIEDITELTDELCVATGMYPKFLVKAGINLRAQQLAKYRKGEANMPLAPIGFAWSGGEHDRRLRVVMWPNTVAALNLHGAFRRDGSGYSLDPKFYATHFSFKATSQSNGEIYHITIRNPSILRANDPRQYYEWRSMEVTDESPDAIFKGLLHSKRRHSGMFFTTNAVAGYMAAALRITETGELGRGREIRTNPFPMPTQEMRDFVEHFRNYVVVGKSEPNQLLLAKFMGAYVVASKYYENAFKHWTPEKH